MSNLYILMDNEQQAFDYPPVLPVETRAVCFSIDNELDNEIKRLRTSTNKVGFLLQYGYFKACKRFFVMNRFRQEDVEYSAKLLGVNIEDIDLSCYKKKMPAEHQKKILTLFDCKRFDNRVYVWLQKEATQQVERQVEPKQIFIHLLNLLIQNKFEIPSYHRLAELITQIYYEFERNLLNKLNKKLRRKDKKLLDALLNENDPNHSTLLNQLKTINQSTKPKAIQASLSLFRPAWNNRHFCRVISNQLQVF
jgi:hypothetical protein